MYRYCQHFIADKFSSPLFRKAVLFSCSLRSSERCTVAEKNFASYIQGQSPEPRIREYFYYIDHQGMVEDIAPNLKCLHSIQSSITTCDFQRSPPESIWKFTDKKFLAFFFKRLRLNETGRYSDDFPYLSLCGRERNFVRCDDLPIVFTHIIQRQNRESSTIENLFSYAHAGELLTVPFEPSKIFMSIKTGRVYHPAPEITASIGLVRSKLAIEFSKFFEFENGEEESPTHFSWDNKRYELDVNWYKELTGKVL